MRFLTLTPSTFLSPVTSVTAESQMKLSFGSEKASFWRAFEARSASLRCITVTLLASWLR